MNLNKFFPMLAICLALSVISCKEANKDDEAKAGDAAEMTAAKPDMAAVKAEIQAINDAWAAASNAKDAAAILAFYAEDAISMSNNKPMAVGKAAIQKDSETWFAKSKEGNVVAFETMEVFGDDKMLTEIGKSTVKDAAGKVVHTGKYMAIWEKRDGKWVTIRDISNDDEKEK